MTPFEGKTYLWKPRPWVAMEVKFIELHPMRPDFANVKRLRDGKVFCAAVKDLLEVENAKLR